MVHVRLIVRTFALFPFFFAPAPAYAWSIGSAISDGAKAIGGAVESGAKPLGGALEDGGEALGEAVGKGAKELGNAARDIVKEGERVVAKVFREIGNGAEDLRILVEEGKCGGDVYIALGAAADMVEGSIKETGQAFRVAEKRLSEGKVLDALWHLSIAPYDIQQENAAKAAMRSSILRAVGQVAASAYGGPYGAAA